jgi:hypothetical protein
MPDQNGAAAAEPDEIDVLVAAELHYVRDAEVKMKVRRRWFRRTHNDPTIHQPERLTVARLTASARQRRLPPLRSRRMPHRAQRPLGTVLHGAEPLVSFSTRVPETLKQRLYIRCDEHGTTVQVFVADALREALRRRPR